MTSQSSDCLSSFLHVGVIAFMLLSSSVPFYGADTATIAAKIIKGKFKFQGSRWKWQISNHAKDFVRELLVVNPDERPDAEEALGCAWLNMRMLATSRVPNAREEEMALSSLLQFAGYTRLKKLVRENRFMNIACFSFERQAHLFLSLLPNFNTRH